VSDIPHHVKCREKGRKAWVFLAPDGVSRLRVHAARFSSEAAAQALIDANAADNPDWEFRAQPINGKGD
jgi:hypothetical protein